MYDTFYVYIFRYASVYVTSIPQPFHKVYSFWFILPHSVKRMYRSAHSCPAACKISASAASIPRRLVHSVRSKLVASA